MFFAVASLIGGLLSSKMASDAQKSYGKDLKAALRADPPPVWQSYFDKLLANAQANQASFEKSKTDNANTMKLVSSAALDW